MIELWSVPTANGQKVHVVLEETGLPYRLSFVDLTGGEHKTPAFRARNPFAKAPMMRDSDGPGGGEVLLGESLAICLYLAEKAGGELLETDPGRRAELMMWLAAISSSVAMPFAMQFFATNLAPEPTPWLVEMMTGAARDNLAVFEARLSDRPFLMGETFGLGDAMLYPVLATSARRLEGWLAGFPNLALYEARVGGRPAVQRGMAAAPD